MDHLGIALFKRKFGNGNFNKTIEDPFNINSSKGNDEYRESYDKEDIDKLNSENDTLDKQDILRRIEYEKAKAKLKQKHVEKEACREEERQKIRKKYGLAKQDYFSSSYQQNVENGLEKLSKRERTRSERPDSLTFVNKFPYRSRAFTSPARVEGRANFDKEFLPNERKFIRENIEDGELKKFCCIL